MRIFTVAGQSLLVDIDKTVELTLAATLLGRLGVVGETSTRVVERVDEAERQGTGDTTRSDVLAERNHVRIALLGLERRLDLVLEGKVERLRREVTNAVGQVASPERVQALRTERLRCAVNNALVRLRDLALFQHLTLVLHEKLNSLDRCSDRLRDDGRSARQEKVLDEAEFGCLLFTSCWCAHLKLTQTKTKTHKTSNRIQDFSNFKTKVHTQALM